MAHHRPDRRRIKVHRSYTVDQASRTIGIGKAAVRRWIKRGLPVIDARRPTLILGRDLLGFLQAKAKPKTVCPPGQCFCVKCKAAREPAAGMAEFVKLTPTNGNLRAICPTCGIMMYRRTSLAQLEQIRCVLEVTTVESF